MSQSQASLHASTVRSRKELSKQLQAASNPFSSSMRRSLSGSFRTRVLTKHRGKTIDIITEEQMKPEVSDTISIYQQDYTPKERLRNFRLSYSYRPKQSEPLAQNDSAIKINVNRSAELISSPSGLQSSLKIDPE